MLDNPPGPEWNLVTVDTTTKHGIQMWSKVTPATPFMIRSFRTECVVPATVDVLTHGHQLRMYFVRWSTRRWHLLGSRFPM